MADFPYDENFRSAGLVHEDTTDEDVSLAITCPVGRTLLICSVNIFRTSGTATYLAELRKAGTVIQMLQNVSAYGQGGEEQRIALEEGDQFELSLDSSAAGSANLLIGYRELSLIT